MSLGRVTADTGVEAEELETVPMKVDGLDDFRAVSIAAGDYISLAIDEEGQMRAWGSFNVSTYYCNRIYLTTAKV